MKSTTFENNRISILVSVTGKLTLEKLPFRELRPNKLPLEDYPQKLCPGELAPCFVISFRQIYFIEVSKMMQNNIHSFDDPMQTTFLLFLR